MLSTQLKEFTAGEHAALEKALVLKIKNIGTDEDYLDIVKLFLGYFKPIEKQLDAHVDIAKMPDYPERRKTVLLESDLEKISAGAFTEVTMCRNIPNIQNHEQCLGAMYVMEGSTLGGRIIRKMINDKLGSQRSTSFFYGYGDHTLLKWEAFKSMIDQPFTEAQKQEILIAAKDTFTYFKNWIDA